MAEMPEEEIKKIRQEGVKLIVSKGGGEGVSQHLFVDNPDFC